MFTDFHNFFHFVQHKLLFHYVIMHFLLVTSVKEKACNNTNQKWVHLIVKQPTINCYYFCNCMS